MQISMMDFLIVSLLLTFNMFHTFFLSFLLITLNKQIFAGLFPTVSHVFIIIVEYIKLGKLTFTCSKSTIETLKKGVKCVQSQQ